MRKISAPKIPELPAHSGMVGYARVSTEEQHLDLQIDALLREGVARDDIHVEKVSTRLAKRPMLAKAIRELREGDKLVVWRLDRIARNIREIYAVLEQIDEAGASLRSLNERFDFSTASGKFMLAIFAAMAEFERDLIADRTKAGMAAAKAKGIKAGRKQKFTPNLQAKAFKMLKAGETITATAAACGVAPPTIGLYFEFGKTKTGKRTVRRKPQQ